MVTKQTWLPVFRDFLGHLTILSKEIPGNEPVPLLDVMYDAQWRFLEEICEGLDRGVRFFVCLKARQLGISTISLAITIFWCMMHERLQGALITDDAANRDKFRLLLEHYIGSLPKGLRVGIKRHNPSNLVLKNGSMLDYLVAGRRKTNTVLGQSRGLSFVHGTEVGSWGSEEGINSLLASLAEQNPDRLYLFESTAHGYNLFKDMWEAAQEDDLTKKAFFVGWMHKNAYSFPRGSAEFVRYDGKLDDAEKKITAEVKQRYGHLITPEQWAWHRHHRTHVMTSEAMMAQNFPSTEDEAFVMTGSSFFPLVRLSDDVKWCRQNIQFRAFAYRLGENFLATEIEQVTQASQAELRVYEEPHPNGIYVIGIDPAFGRSDENANHAIEVLRCYADKVVQVAEYATSRPESYQLAWVMAHLAGAYRNAWLNIEINGPGTSVMQELRHLRQLMDSGKFAKSVEEKGLVDIFGNVRWYLYHRPDAMGAGYAYAWKTTADNKLTILNQLRDSYSLQSLRVRSIPLLEEMQRVVQDGGSIEGHPRDDRVFAMALANKAWIEWVRPGLIANNQTYDIVVEEERRRMEAEASGKNLTFTHAIVSDFFRSQEDKREADKNAAAWRGEWRF